MRIVLRTAVVGLAAAAVTVIGPGVSSVYALVQAQVEVSPTSAGFPGGQMIQRLINWAGQFALWGSVASVLIGAGIWAVSQQFGNGFQAGKGKILAASGAVGAVLTGLAAVIVNTLFTAARG